MVLYDVILVGFPEGPKVGKSEAEALSTVFGIPRDTAERMVADIPTVVKSGVPEDVCRKYFNAFTYMGAKCDFAVTGENPLVDDVVGTPRLASTDIIAVAVEGGDENPEFPTQRDEAVSRTDSAPVEAVGAPGGGEQLEPATADTSRALPNQLLRDMRLEQAAAQTDSHEVARVSGDDGSAAIDGGDRLPARSATNEPFDLVLYAEMTPPEISGWPVKGLDLPTQGDEDELPEVPEPPKASIVDANPAIGGTREPGTRVQPAPDIDSDSWGTASDSAPVDFLARAATTGEPILTDPVIPRETTGVPAAVWGADQPAGGGPSVAEIRAAWQAGQDIPSVAEIRAAWQAGQDIPLGPTEEGEPPSLGAWDPWIDSELPDADFPSGVAVSDSQSVEDVDDGEGTNPEVPVTSRLMAQLDAQRRRQELLGNVAGLKRDDGNQQIGEGTNPEVPVTSRLMAQLDAQRRRQELLGNVAGLKGDDGNQQIGEGGPVDSGAPLFGAPLGAAAVSEREAISAAKYVEKEEPEPEVEAQPNPEPTEVPMAAMNFRRRKKKPDAD